LIKPKLVSKYVKAYLGELAKLVEKVPEETRMLLPDHVIASQEIRVYITTKTGIAIDYVGLSAQPEITFRGSDRSFEDLHISSNRV